MGQVKGANRKPKGKVVNDAEARHKIITILGGLTTRDNTSEEYLCLRSEECGRRPPNQYDRTNNNLLVPKQLNHNGH